jgi:hypothetical protein
MPMNKCVMCGGSLPPRKSKYCSNTCHKERNAEYAISKRTQEGDTTVGLGKGGSNKTGEDHNQFVSGMGQFYKIRKAMREDVKHCQSCDKDLTTATRWEWCVHHIDHDRTNNVRSNFEMLCKRCHQIEHECWLAFNK